MGFRLRVGTSQGILACLLALQAGEQGPMTRCLIKYSYGLNLGFRVYGLGFRVNCRVLIQELLMLRNRSLLGYCPQSLAVPRYCDNSMSGCGGVGALSKLCQLYP